MAYPDATIAAARNLLGQLPHAEIAIRCGISIGTVKRIASGEREPFEDPGPEVPVNVGSRCPGCGGLLLEEPCVLCRTRRYMAAKKKQREARRALVLVAVAWLWNLLVPAASPAEVAFVSVAPLRSVPTSSLGGVLADVESRMPPGHIYANAGNAVNWAHETTHGLNSRIRNASGRSRVNAFYLLEGRAVILTEPPLRLSQVMRLVPPGFDLTSIQLAASHWEDCPLYGLDEWTAYTNGTECGLDREAHGLRPGPGDEVFAVSLEHAVALNAYAAALCQAVSRLDPRAYAERDQLIAFVAWHTQRVLALAERARTQSKLFWRPQTAAVVARFEGQFIASDSRGDAEARSVQEKRL